MPRGLLFLVMALLLGGCAAWLVADWLDRAARLGAQAAVPPVAMAEILVARVGLQPGDKVTEDLVRWQSWPLPAVQQNHLVRGKAMPDQYLGALARGTIASDEPVLSSHLIRPGDHGIMAALINPGRRAISIPVTAASGLAGFVGAGDRVDIILTVHRRDSDRVVSRTVARNVRVLAIDQRIQPIAASTGEGERKPPAPATVTLEVTSHQAEQLAAAQELGRLSLALLDLQARQQPPADTENGNILKALLDADVAPVPMAPARTTAPARAGARPQAIAGVRHASSGVEVVRGGRVHVNPATSP